MNAANERFVLIAMALADPLLPPLRQLVIAEEIMHALRELALERRHQIEELMRFVAAVGIFERPMNDLLDNQMAARVLGEIGSQENATKVFDLAMKIAHDHEFVSRRQLGETPDSAGRRIEKRCCSAQGRQEARWVGHEVATCRGLSIYPE